MKHKFKIDAIIGEHEEETPTLYVIYFSTRYYIHKSKSFTIGLERFLYDIHRKLIDEGITVSKYYDKVVEYCRKYPQTNRVRVEVVMSGSIDKVIRKEKQLLKVAKDDEFCLNTELPVLVPEWANKEIMQKRCLDCITHGIVGDKKMKFAFCPNCGRLNKKKK